MTCSGCALLGPALGGAVTLRQAVVDTSVAGVVSVRGVADVLGAVDITVELTVDGRRHRRARRRAAPHRGRRHPVGPVLGLALDRRDDRAATPRRARANASSTGR